MKQPTKLNLTFKYLIMKKYTYTDWLDGKIILKYDCIIPQGETPILVEWNDFNTDEDILLIKRKQKEIFDERVTNLLEKYKSVFNKQIEASYEPEEHYRMTLNQIDNIFTGGLPKKEFIPTEYWNCVFYYKDLYEIKEYYKNCIMGGVEVDYAFINSPTMNYQRQGVNSQIYAHTLYLFRKWLETLQPQQTETKTDNLKAELGKYGFFELPKVKLLSEVNKQRLVELVSTNGLPYSIAMFDFLGFLKHIGAEHFKTKSKLNREVAKWFHSDKEGRAVKGNISSLSAYSKENKEKYTAHTHKETVITDYQKLK